MDTLNTGKRFVKQRLLDPLSDLYWGIYGRTVRNPDIGGRPSSCLFVCLGNICRSPFAERMARLIFGESNMCEVEVVSAGLNVSVPLQPPEAAVSAARRFGVSLDGHRSTALTEGMLDRSDMILVMETSQFLTLRGRFPDKRGAIFLLPLFDGHRVFGEGNYHRYNISDPYGRDLERFVVCYDRIARCIQGLTAAIAGRTGRS